MMTTTHAQHIKPYSSTVLRTIRSKRTTYDMRAAGPGMDRADLGMDRADLERRDDRRLGRLVFC